MHDTIIIGKGPAGITAAIYLKRANLNPIVIGKDGGSLEKTDKVANYYGFKDPIDGNTLIQNGIKQAQKLEIEVKTDEVISITYDGIFNVKTKNTTYQGKTVMLATGSNRNTPKIKGVKEFEGKGVSYCAICDAFFYRGKDVAVLGSGDYALNEASELLPVAKSVTILTNGKELVQNRSNPLAVNEIQKEIRGFTGEDRIEKVEFTDNSDLEISGVFVAEGVASSSDFARKLGAIVEGKNIVVNDAMETNIPGLYAAGDCTGGILQISKAVYQGTAGALAIIKKLRLTKNKEE